MKKSFLVCAAASILLATTNKVISQTTVPDFINPRTTAVPFLRIAGDARSSGMGDLGLATTPDANSALWNLAKTPFAKSKAGLAFTYTPWLRDLGINDIYLATLAGYNKSADGQSAFGGSIRYFSLGNIQFTDNNGTNLQTYRPTEIAYHAGYARKLSERLSLSVAFKYIYSNLISGGIGGTVYSPGSTIAGDIGLYYDGTKSEKNGGGFAWGLTLSNLGGKIGYTGDDAKRDFIPANLGFGFNYNYVIDESNKLNLGLDLNKLLVPAPPTLDGDTAKYNTNLAEYRTGSVLSSWGKSFGDGGGFVSSMNFSLGAEYSYADQLFVRAGYFTESKIEGDRSFATMGVGIKYNVMTFNFSYLVASGQGTTRNPLSNTLRFGLTFDLDGDESK
jgi:Type IX secretion system protein PorV